MATLRGRGCWHGHAERAWLHVLVSERASTEREIVSRTGGTSGPITATTGSTATTTGSGSRSSSI